MQTLNKSLEEVQNAVTKSCRLDAELAGGEFSHWERLLDTEISSKKNLASGRILHEDFINGHPYPGRHWWSDRYSVETAEHVVLKHSCQDRFVVNGDTFIFYGGVTFTGQYDFKISIVVNGV